MRGKKTNPLAKPLARNINPSLASSSLLRDNQLKVQKLESQFPKKLWPQQEVDDVLRPYFADEVKKLDAAFDYWLRFADKEDEYYDSQNEEMQQHILHWPLFSEEVIEAIEKTRPGERVSLFNQTSGAYANPWANNLRLAWEDLILSTLMYGPEGQRIAVENILPAAKTYCNLRKKYYTSPSGREDLGLAYLKSLIKQLEILQENGVLNPPDAVSLRQKTHQEAFKNYGRTIAWSKPLEKAWADSADEVLQLANEYKNNGETPAGLQLLTAFCQQVGAPFYTVAHDALMDPTWTKNL